ncbi:MAG: DUF2817 domain-containing protein [Phycisphaerales bacterium]
MRERLATEWIAGWTRGPWRSRALTRVAMASVACAAMGLGACAARPDSIDAGAGSAAGITAATEAPAAADVDAELAEDMPEFVAAAPEATVEAQPATAPSSDARPARTEPRIVLLGTSVQDRPIEAFIHGDGERLVVIMATIHGDEWAGTPLLETLGDELALRDAGSSAGLSAGLSAGAGSASLAGRTVVLVPLVNPDGYVARLRGNINGVDLNRNFAADNRQDRQRYGAAAESEPEAAAVARLVDGTVLGRRPDLIVSLHQPVAVVDWDGPEPAGTISAIMAEACDLPARRIGSRPGSLGSWAGLTLGIPTITFELPAEAGADPDADAARYLPALRAAIAFVPAPASIGALNHVD